jgi:hypothetical protein
MENLSCNNWSLDSDLNPGPPKYEAGVLPLHHDVWHEHMELSYGNDIIITIMLHTSSLADHFQDKGKNFPSAFLWLVLLRSLWWEGYVVYIHSPHLTGPVKIQPHLVCTSEGEKGKSTHTPKIMTRYIFTWCTSWMNSWQQSSQYHLGTANLWPYNAMQCNAMQFMG